MKVLVINCGSSSLKFQLIDSDSEKVIAKGLCERIGIDGSVISYSPAGGEKIINETPMPDHKRAIELVIAALTDEKTGVVKSLSEIGAVGHRIVHGGEKFTKSVVITDEVKKAIENVSDLAPLHNPANLIGVNACEELMPGVKNVAVFDTAFHQTMPEESYLYGLPYDLYEKYRIRRYGFHGTSHAFVSDRLAELVGKDKKELKLIVAHLGNGASISAVKNGSCVDTSMGLTPLEGLIMGTRSGDLDPSIVEFLCKKENISVSEALNILNKKSGVLGLSSNLSSDFRDLEEGYEKANAGAKRAIDGFVLRVVKYIGSYVAEMNGVDAIAFTAGVGENSVFVRKMVVERLSYLGITLDEAANNTRGEDKLISTADSKVKVFIVPTNEELAIARDTVALV